MTWGAGLLPGCQCCRLCPFCQMLLGYFLFEFLIFNPFLQLIALCFGLGWPVFCSIRGPNSWAVTVFHTKCIKYVSLVMHGKMLSVDEMPDWTGHGLILSCSLLSAGLVCLSEERETPIITFESRWFSL